MNTVLGGDWARVGAASSARAAPVHRTVLIITTLRLGLSGRGLRSGGRNRPLIQATSEQIPESASARLKTQLLAVLFLTPGEQRRQDHRPYDIAPSGPSSGLGEPHAADPDELAQILTELTQKTTVMD